MKEKRKQKNFKLYSNALHFHDYVNIQDISLFFFIFDFLDTCNKKMKSWKKNCQNIQIRNFKKETI